MTQLHPEGIGRGCEDGIAEVEYGHEPATAKWGLKVTF